MAADGTLLQGEVIEDPQGEEKDVEKFLAGFLRALLREQGPLFDGNSQLTTPQIMENLIR